LAELERKHHPHRAAGGAVDLRHLTGFLAAGGREHVVSNLDPEDVRLSQLAADQARELERIVEEIERRLEGRAGRRVRAAQPLR